MEPQTKKESLLTEFALLVVLFGILVAVYVWTHQKKEPLPEPTYSTEPNTLSSPIGIPEYYDCNGHDCKG